MENGPAEPGAPGEAKVAAGGGTGGAGAAGGGIRTRVSAYALITGTTPGDGADGDGGAEDHSGAPDGILLTRLSHASPIFAPGLWHPPGGGIDPGEQPVEALARELDEETGLTLLSARLLTARAYTATRLGISWHLVALFYAVEAAPGPLRVTEADGSTADVAWLALDELRDEAVRRERLSPAAVDGLRLLEEAAGGEGPRG
ncbi:NUDIX hydrolase [Streptomyces pactum]|uniref:NUDIX hydrolase n=1 Tax=Streptomyces pactum TaxID=68249 RepID=UPI0027DBFB9A|nr:NUDIX domain-containing protein [Streptomyces pactum]